MAACFGMDVKLDYISGLAEAMASGGAGMGGLPITFVLSFFAFTLLL